MKSTVLTVTAFLLLGTAANAQLSFLPQVGFEQNRTSLNYNALSTSGMQGNFKAALKVDYRFKSGHSPFVNVATSPAPMHFSFNESGTLMNNGQSVKENLRLRLEAGYQYSSKPIQLGKSSSASKMVTTPVSQEGITQKRSCGSSSYTSRCGSQKMRTKSVQATEALAMRLQPSVALAYIPANNQTIKSGGGGFTYDANNWKTAIVPAMGFEFDRGRQRLFTLTVFYTKPLQQTKESFTSLSTTKPVITSLQSAASTWGMTLGVPFSFTKTKAAKTHREKKECTRTYSRSYRRCSKI